MKRDYLSFLCCPACQAALSVDGTEDERGVIASGTLACTGAGCGRSYPIVNAVPRFVQHGRYASSFGAQWRTFARTQLDGPRSKESRLRWDTEVGWTADDVAGKLVVEFGSGAGRFVDVVSRLGAKLAVGVDITDAVDASQENLGGRGNCFFVQADFFRPPIRRASMDLGYSIGVMHHTPEPEEAFNQLVATIRESGSVAVGLYDISLHRRPNRDSLAVATKDLLWAANMWRCEIFRAVTTRVPEKALLAYCKTVIPVLHRLNKVPVVGVVRYALPSTCYKDLPVEWSMVDTFDTYATKIVHRYRAKDVFQWFLKAGLHDIVVMNSRAGWISLVASKSRAARLAHERYVRQQPGAPAGTDRLPRADVA